MATDWLNALHLANLHFFFSPKSRCQCFVKTFDSATDNTPYQPVLSEYNYYTPQTNTFTYITTLISESTIKTLQIYIWKQKIIWKAIISQAVETFLTFHPIKIFQSPIIWSSVIQFPLQPAKSEPQTHFINNFSIAIKFNENLSLLYFHFWL